MNNTLTRRSFAALGTAAAAAFAAGCASGQQAATSDASADAEGSAEQAPADAAAEPASTALTLCLDFTPNTNHTGIYVAQHEGYYAEEGIDLTIIQPGDTSAELLVGAGQSELGVSYQDYMAGAFDGGTTDIVAVAAVVQHNTSGIMSRAEDGISSPAKMEGHDYATWELPVELAMVQQVVEEDGGDFAAVNLVPCEFDDGVAALQTGLCDCVWEYEGWAVQRAALQGVDVGWFLFTDIERVFDYYTPVLIANTGFAAENPEALRAFLRATAKGYAYAIEHPKEAGEMLVEEVPELDASLVELSMVYLAGQYQAEAEQWGVFDEERWAAFFQWLNDNSLVENPLNPSAGFTNEYLA